MASVTKSQMTDEAEGYIASLTNDKRRAEAQELDQIFRRATGFKPMLWAGKMIGYGRYDYTYASGHSGSWFATGFAVPDRQITVYVMPGYTPFEDLLSRIGKYRKGKSCLYINRLDGIDASVLEELVAAGVKDLASRWPVHPT
jgi:hypothetical protein